MPDEDAIRTLAGALREGPWEQRQEAVFALERLGWKPSDGIERACFAIANRNFHGIWREGASAIGPLISALNAKFLGTQRFAEEALKESRAIDVFTEAVPQLARALRVGRWENREAAVGALEVAAKVLPRLAWKPSNGVERACVAIAHRDQKAVLIEGESAIEPLISALHAHAWRTRGFAAGALAEFRDPRFVDALIGILQEPTSKRKRDGDSSDKDEAHSKIILALGKIGGSRAAEWLTEKLRAESRPVQNASPLERKQSAKARHATAESLGKLKEPSAVKLLISSLLRDSVRYPTTEEDGAGGAAATALAEIGAVGEATLQFTKALNINSWEQREGAVRALLRLGWKPSNGVERACVAIVHKDRKAVLIEGEAAIDPLISAMHADDWGIRGFAAEALGQFNDPRVFEELIAILHDFRPTSHYKESWEVVVRAAEALGRFKDPRSVAPLIDALRWDAARLAVISALGEMGDRSAADALIKCLGDQSFVVRATAAESLGKIKEPRAVAPLIGLLGSLNAEVLSRYDYPIQVQDRVYCAAAKALGEIGDATAVEPLIAGLRYGYPERAEYIAVALGKLRDARAVEGLVSVLGNRGWGFDAQSRAAWALGEIKDGRATETLVAALRSHSGAVSSAAANSLTSLGWIPSCAEDEVWMAIAQAKWHLAAKLASRCMSAFLAAFEDCEEARFRAFESTMSESGEVCAIPVSVALARASGLTSCSVLSRLFDRFRHEISMADLEALASLQDAFRVTFVSHKDVGFLDDFHYCERGKERLECSSLRQMARQEIESRKKQLGLSKWFSKRSSK